MFSVRKTLVALLLSSAMPLCIVFRIAPAIAATPTTTFENGADLRLVHVTNNVAEPMAFGPDGSAYSITRGGYILRIATNGARTLISPSSGAPATAGAQIAFSNGFLWFQVYHGLERVKVDGSDGRYYAPLSSTGERSINNLTAGPDGIYYLFVGNSIDRKTGQPYYFPMLAEISNSFKMTYISLAPSVPPKDYGGYATLGALAAAPGGSVYFEAAPLVDGGSFGRVDATGAVTSFKHLDPCGPAQQLVYARGAFYFNAFTQEPYAGPVSLCRVSLTGFYSKLYTSNVAPVCCYFAGITADAAGDLWTSNLFGPGLYSYAISTGAVMGPYDPTFLSALGQLYSGPDENIYFYSEYGTQVYFGAYLRHQLAFVPTIVSLYSGDPSMDFYVTEPLPSAPWTARSLNPAVATVQPVSSLPGRFKVTETGVGTTSIAVTDVFGNTSYVPVTAN